MSDHNRRPPEQDHGLHRHCFAEVRFFKWQKSETSVSLRAQSGSYGGGSEVLVIERRFSNVIIRDTDVAPTIEAGAGGGG